MNKITREKLPTTRSATVHKFAIAGHRGYLIVGTYDDGKPGEIFITMHKQGSTIAGFVDAVAIAVSIGLQHGVSLETYVKKYAYTRFEPAGFTGNPEISHATSVLDYVFRWLALRYAPGALSEDTAPALDLEPIAPDPDVHEQKIWPTCKHTFVRGDGSAALPLGDDPTDLCIACNRARGDTITLVFK